MSLSVSKFWRPTKTARAKRRARPAVAGLALLLVTGCSSFNRDWDNAGRNPPPVGGIEGRWEGTWRSDVNAHVGPLRCLITPAINGTNSTRFQAKYRKLIQLTFSYTVPLTVTNREDGLGFEGAADLGWLAGGRYTYRGRATATNFYSTYESRHDRGVFEMIRPASARDAIRPGQP